MSSEKTNIRHTERVLAAEIGDDQKLPSAERDRQAFIRDVDTARGNLERKFPGAEGNADLAKQLAWTLMLERSRREAHLYRYRLMTRAAMNAPLFDADENFPEVSMLDIEKRTSVMTDDDWAMAAFYSGKGISAELGHVDQLGDWEVGRDLDEAVRQLPHSEMLAQAGFVFGDTYDGKDTARLSYEFYITDGGLKAKRKRAAADVITENGTIYNIVKSSIFVVNETELLDEHSRVMHSVKRSLSDKDLTDKELRKRDDVFAEAGRTVVEPFITEKELRERSAAVLAATSLYFALVRHR